MKVSHSNTVWLGYTWQLCAKYSYGGITNKDITGQPGLRVILRAILRAILGGAPETR